MSPVECEGVVGLLTQPQCNLNGELYNPLPNHDDWDPSPSGSSESPVLTQVASCSSSTRRETNDMASAVITFGRASESAILLSESAILLSGSRKSTHGPRKFGG